MKTLEQLFDLNIRIIREVIFEKTTINYWNWAINRLQDLTRNAKDLNTKEEKEMFSYRIKALRHFTENYNEVLGK